MERLLFPPSHRHLPIHLFSPRPRQQPIVLHRNSSLLPTIFLSFLLLLSNIPPNISFRSPTIKLKHYKCSSTVLLGRIWGLADLSAKATIWPACHPDSEGLRGKRPSSHLIPPPFLLLAPPAQPSFLLLSSFSSPKKKCAFFPALPWLRSFAPRPLRVCPSSTSFQNGTT